MSVLDGFIDRGAKSVTFQDITGDRAVRAFGTSLTRLTRS